MVSFRKYALQPVTKQAMRSREKLGMAGIRETPRTEEFCLLHEWPLRPQARFHVACRKLPQIQVSSFLETKITNSSRHWTLSSGSFVFPTTTPTRLPTAVAHSQRDVAAHTRHNERQSYQR